MGIYGRRKPNLISNIMTTEIKSFIIGKKIEALRFTVEHYKNGYMPDIYEYTGANQWQHLERAEQRLERFKQDLAEYRATQNFDCLGITDGEKLQYIRLYAVEQREQAQDFPENVWIVMRSLRNAVTACNILKSMRKELEVYSNYWLCTRNRITLN